MTSRSYSGNTVRRLREQMQRMTRRQTPPPPARRRHPRRALFLRAQAIAGGREVIGTATSLGMGGMFLMCHETFPSARSVTVRMTLCTGMGEHDVELDGRIVYRDREGMGVEFVGMSPADFQSLRAFFLYICRPSEDTTPTGL